jgi:hypothetical protein
MLSKTEGRQLRAVSHSVVEEAALTWLEKPRMDCKAQSEKAVRKLRAEVQSAHHTLL